MYNDSHDQSFDCKLKFAIHLQKQFSGELGFLPTVALGEYMKRGCIDFAQENDDDAGYLLIRPMRDRSKLSIVQAAVCKDAQRRHVGLALVQSAIAARAAGVRIVQAWCASDIEAVNFWRAAGFEEILREERGNSRKREMILYRRALVEVSADELHEIPARAGWKARGAPKDGQLDLISSTPNRIITSRTRNV